MSSFLDHAKGGDLVSQARIDVNISQIVNESFFKYSKGASLKDYYYVTNLVNPVFSYWEKKNHINSPDYIQKKLDFGNYIHRISKYWLKDLDGFVFSEGSVVGSYVGMDRISGKIDYQVGKCIVEIKTKEQPVQSVDEVLDKYPQDLEQLLIYVAISNSAGYKHKLVFINGTRSNNLTFTSFEITINDLQGIRSQVTIMRDLLDEAIRKDTQSKLPRCRIY